MTRKQSLTKVSKAIATIGLESLQEKVGKVFYNMDDVVRVLYYALLANKNVILHGPGGFGKSQVVKEVLKQAKIAYSTIVGYEDMDVEALLGLPNIPKMLEQSQYEINFEKTVFKNPGVLVLEEFLDVNPRTAVALKDILTEGGLRQGNNFSESLISSVIICSNKSPQELSLDLSTTAFYKERFPIVMEIKWEKYDYHTYLAYIKKLIGEEELEKHRDVYEVLAELCDRNSSKHEIVSPRIVKDAIELVQSADHSVSIIELIDAIDTSDIYSVILNQSFKKEENKITQWVNAVEEKLKEILSEENKSTRFIIDSISDINYLINKLKTIQVTHETHAASIGKTIVKCEQAHETLWTLYSTSFDTSKSELDKLFAE